MRSLVVSLTSLSNGKALLKARDVRPTDTDTKMAHHSDPMNHRQVLSDLAPPNEPCNLVPCVVIKRDFSSNVSFIHSCDLIDSMSARNADM